MFKNTKLSVNGLKAVILLIATSFTLSWADVPPPPVNQNVGIPDSVFNNLEKQNCWYCHIPSRLNDAELANLGWTFTAPTVKDGVITDRHHARVGRIIEPNTQAPFGVVGEPYQCLSCHIIEWDETISANVVVENFTNCLNCHTQLPGQASVHHLTAPAQALNCQHCHGARIDNPGDGHYIPVGRTPTLVTPRTSAGKGLNGQGACTYCHNEGVESVSGVAVQKNSINHHSTGIGQDGVSDLDCTVCHDQVGTDWAIRRCQDCHGINSIHNIQADSNGDGVLTVGGEAAFYGHIGNSPIDCNGCHGGYIAASTYTAPFSGPVVPEIVDMSTFRVTAGSVTTITVTGQALTNEVATANGPVELRSQVTLTHSDGAVTELTPDVISESSLDVTIPADIAVGNYYVRAVKGPNASNPLSLTVVPKVVISNVSATGETVTVNGIGFGGHLNAVNSGTSVTLAGAGCSIDTWSDTQIVANCATAQCGSLVIDTVNGTTTGTISCSDSPAEREKRRSRDKRR